eukprot:766991-Hanusia_phi.AAC.3
MLPSSVDPTQPTHCLSGQTYVLDFHVDQSAKVTWAKLQRILSTGDTVPNEAESVQRQWTEMNEDIAAGIVTSILELESAS